MKVLVTGATGFVGRALVDYLLANQHDVFALVREFSSTFPGKVNQVVFGDLAVLNKIDSSASLGMTDKRGRGLGTAGKGSGMTETGQHSPEIEALEHTLKKIDVVIHTAARVHVMNDSVADPLAEFRSINTEATLRLARLALNAGVGRFVFLSTIKVNGEFTTLAPTFARHGGREVGSPPSQPSSLEGEGAEKPSSELSSNKGEGIEEFSSYIKGGRGNHLQAWDEPLCLSPAQEKRDTPSPMVGEGWGEGDVGSKPFMASDTPSPQDPYAISKWEAEQGLMEIARETDMEVIIIRPPLIYGPGVRGNFASMMRWVRKGIPLPLGAVNNQRSLLALDNLVAFIIHCIAHPKAANELFLLSDGQDVSTTELIRKLAIVHGKKARLLSVPVSWMRFAARLLGKQDVADRLFGSLQIDSSKAHELLDWKPPVSMDEQLKKMVE